MSLEFKSWASIPRIENEVWGITEKIDGTNGLIAIPSDLHSIYIGSRNRWLDPHNDNYGFCHWVMDNEQELLKLGPGYHYGEWYGQGIHREYGLTEKKFVLFYLSKKSTKPNCCEVIPELNFFNKNKGSDLLSICKLAESFFKDVGSIIAPGYMNPEGFIIKSNLTGKRYKYLF